MLNFILARVFKAILLGVVTYIAVKLLTGENFAAYVVAAVPVILTSADVYTKVGAAITVIALVLLVASVLMPPAMKRHVMIITSQYGSSLANKLEASSSDDGNVSGARRPTRSGDR